MNGRRRLLHVLIGVVLPVTLLTSCSSTPGESGASPTSYYVVLGDSIAAGFDATTPQQSYPGLIYTHELVHFPGLQQVSYACGGATTASMITGPACNSTTGSQLGLADAFLTAHKGHIALVTIDIGADNIYDCLLPPATNMACVNKGMGQISSQLPKILGDLKDADPGVSIVAMNYYDPFFVYWLNGDHAWAEQTLSIFSTLNLRLGLIYDQAGVRMANVFTAYQAGDLTEVPYNGTHDPQNLVNLCNWTKSCQGDPHPNNTGHEVIAKQFYPLLPKN
jgi:lysophospholipase L1-like esterase